MAESDNFEDGNRDESAIVFGQEGRRREGEKKGTITNRQMAIFHVELFGICSLDSSLLWRLSGYLIEQQLGCKSTHKWRSKIDSTVAVAAAHFKICQIARARRRNEITIPRIPTAAFPPFSNEICHSHSPTDRKRASDPSLSNHRIQCVTEAVSEIAGAKKYALWRGDSSRRLREGWISVTE